MSRLRARAPARMRSLREAARHVGGGLARASWAGKAGTFSLSLAADQRAPPYLRPRVLSPRTRWTPRAEDR